MSASWFLVLLYLIWILGSKMIRSNNQSRATLWVLETCLIVGLLPFLISLITASLSSKIFNKASLREEFTFEETKSTLFRSSICPWNFFRVRDVDKFHRTSLLWFVLPLRTVTIRSHKSSANIPSILKPASKEMISDSVELCETEVCFLHIQLIGTNVWLPQTAQCSTWCRFWILKISCKIEVLKQSQSALFCSVSRMTILFVFTCVMDVRDQTR